jgi:hypothetical protein
MRKNSLENPTWSAADLHLPGCGLAVVQFIARKSTGWPIQIDFDAYWAGLTPDFDFSSEPLVCQLQPIALGGVTYLPCELGRGSGNEKVFRAIVGAQLATEDDQTAERPPQPSTIQRGSSTPSMQVGHRKEVLRE